MNLRVERSADPCALLKYYHLAKNLSDALQALQALPPPIRIVAGGTDLLLDLQQGRSAPVKSLVDITAVPELRKLEIRQDPALERRLFVGAGVLLCQVAAHALVSQHARALVDACRLIGGPQVRNSATLGGNVAHALPAADGSIALLALDAQAEIADASGSRVVPLADLYLGPGKSALKPGAEILVGFYLPLQEPGQASAFLRVMRPQGVALPVLNMACWLHRQGDQVVDLRLSVGPGGAIPHRARAVEQALSGKTLTPAALEQVGKVLLDDAHFRTSPRRATTQYRQHLSLALFSEVLQTAWEHAGEAMIGR